MGHQLEILLLAAAIAGAPTVAAAAPAAPPVTALKPTAAKCRVVGGKKLPSHLRRQDICSAIAEAMAAKAPGAPYKVEIQVRSRSKLAAVLSVDGRVFPAQNLAVSDGELSHGSIARFAASLADLAAQK